MSHDQIHSLAGAITIRSLTAEDGPAIAHLAARDSASPPAGELLGVEVEGRLLAAISLPTGASVADPFSRTEQLRAILALRRAELLDRARPPRVRTARGKARRAPLRRGLPA